MEFFYLFREAHQPNTLAFCFYDAASLVLLSKSIVKVWVTALEYREGQPVPSDFLDRPFEVLESLKVLRITYLYEINCPERRYRIIEVHAKEGEVQKELQPNNAPEAIEYREIYPDDNQINTLWGILCSQPMLK